MKEYNRFTINVACGGTLQYDETLIGCQRLAEPLPWKDIVAILAAQDLIERLTGLRFRINQTPPIPEAE